MTALPFSLERSVVIRARPETVFRFFTDSARFAAWWGSGSAIDARPGGAVTIRYPGGVEVTGEVVELAPERRISFTYGYVANAALIPPGGSLVTITFDTHPDGTLVHLRHDVATEAARDAHVPGWAYQLALFANAVANEQHRDAPAIVDRYLASWSDPDAAHRLGELAAVTTPDMVFRDAFGVAASPEQLAAHIAQIQVHMPGLALSRVGDLRHCQGTAIAEWAACAPDGTVAARGTNIFDFAADGRIARVIGLWAPR